jgi:hypothetical protein
VALNAKTGVSSFFPAAKRKYTSFHHAGFRRGGTGRFTSSIRERAR